MKEYSGPGTLSKLSSIIKSALAGKQNALTHDNSVTLVGDKIGVKTPVKGVYTQAEYDALPEAEKAAGMYVISDGGGGSGGGGSSQTGEIYSTEETQIGTWIDGSPLYRRVFITSAQITPVPHDITITEDLTILPVSFSGYYATHYENQVYRNPITSSYPGSNKSFVRGVTVSYTSGVGIYALAFDNAAYDAELYLIMEYTKTTDNPEVSA